MEMNMFCHFGPNTFTGMEWGLGTEAEDIFNPTAMDCGQWASIAKAIGFKGIIITGKHHDGLRRTTDHVAADDTRSAARGVAPRGRVSSTVQQAAPVTTAATDGV